MIINKSGNLKDHIPELNRKCEVFNRKISAIGVKQLLKLKLYETCLMPTFLYGLEAWGKIDKDEMNQIEKFQGRALKRIFNLPISTSKGFSKHFSPLVNSVKKLNSNWILKTQFIIRTFFSLFNLFDSEKTYTKVKSTPNRLCNL